MKTYGFVIEVVISEDNDKTFIVRLTNGNVLGIFESVGAVGTCLDHLTDPAPSAADK